MANEIVHINNVTRREIDGIYYYYFPKATIKVNTNPSSIDDHIVEIRQLDNFAQIISKKYSDITDKLTSTNALEYVDELAIREFFFVVTPTNKVKLFENVDKINVNTDFLKTGINNIQEILKDQLTLLKSIAE